MSCPFSCEVGTLGVVFGRVTFVPDDPNAGHERSDDEHAIVRTCRRKLAPELEDDQKLFAANPANEIDLAGLAAEFLASPEGKTELQRCAGELRRNVEMLDGGTVGAYICNEHERPTTFDGIRYAQGVSHRIPAHANNHTVVLRGPICRRSQIHRSSEK